MVEVRIFVLLAAAAAAATCAARGGESPAPVPELRSSTLRLAGEVVLRAAAGDTGIHRVGGLSGIVPLRGGRELLAVSDDRDASRVLRFHVRDRPAWSIEAAGTIPLTAGPGAPVKLDPEGIALTSDGHLLISSEGVGNEEPRVPPSINEYSPDGRFIRQLVVRRRYHPNPTGPLVTGVRGNGGFESLTTSPDLTRLFTGVELPLVQDDGTDPFARGRTRILEYTSRGGSYAPAREFVYEIEPLERPRDRVRFAVNGLVELLALGRTELLALERGFVESHGGTASMNRIRIFRIDLDGASDVSALPALRGTAEIVPVRKTLLVDLNALPGLSPALANLDNFEGLAWGPPDADGRRPLILVSDDNFNPRQVTAFLFLRPGRP